MSKTKAAISKWTIVIQIILVFTIVLSCKKKNTIPTIETIGLSNLTSQSVAVQVKLNNPSNLAILEKGVAWFTISGLNPNQYSTPVFRTTESTSLNIFNSVVKNLQPNTTYYVRAYFLDNQGCHYGNEIPVTTVQSETTPFNLAKNYGSVSDIDGNQYKTVAIGNKTWMAENLRVSKFNDGSVISELLIPWSFYNNGIPNWCYYNDSSIYENPHGKLYNMNVITSTKNVCPIGWHVPTQSDYVSLTNNLTMTNPGGEIKSTGYNYWDSPNTGATNETGFSAIGSGERTYIFSSLKSVARFWYETSGNPSTFSVFLSGFEQPILTQTYTFTDLGCSIRCIQD
jgi:uncharacterized protein (TIGR02145 family)